MTSVALKRLAVVVLLLVGGLTIPVESHAVSFTVNSQANIFGAGHTTAPGGGQLPPGFGFAAGPGQVVTFSNVAGMVSCCGGSSPNDPEGGIGFSGTDINSASGISGMIHTSRIMFLVGVFLDATEPTDPAPGRLSFTHPEDFIVLSPAIEQTFFIGDGLTDTGGITQQFLVPGTATRLFLGFVDGSGFRGNPGSYADNTGSFTGEFTISPATAPVPEPATVLLLGSTLGVMGYAVRKRGRR